MPQHAPGGGTLLETLRAMATPKSPLWWLLLPVYLCVTCVTHAGSYVVCTRSRPERARSDLRALENALQLHALKNGGCPSPEEGWKALVQSGDLKELPLDPWGQPYGYASSTGAYAGIWTLGADQQFGGGGENADIIRRFPCRDTVSNPRRSGATTCRSPPRELSAPHRHGCGA